MRGDELEATPFVSPAYEEARRSLTGATIGRQRPRSGPRLHFWRSSPLRLRTACPLRSHLSMIILLSDVDHARRRRRAKQNFILLLARRRRRAWSTRESTGHIAQRVLMGVRSEVSAVKTARSAIPNRFWRPRVTPAGRRALSLRRENPPEEAHAERTLFEGPHPPRKTP